MRHRFFPFTAGDRHGWPDRVRAPQRGLASIGPVLRRRCCGSGAIFSPVSSSLELNRRSVLVAAAWQKPAFSSAGLANACPVLRTPSRLSSRSSESNSVRHRRARLIRWQRAQSRRTKIPPSGGYFAWGCFVKNLIIFQDISLIFHVLASRILIVS
jgi:hypothetical protein